MVVEKLCKWCGVEKPLTDFYKKPAMVDGHLNKCIECVKAYEKQRRQDPVMGPKIRSYDRNRPNAAERNEANKEAGKRRHATEDGRKARQEQLARWERENPDKKSAQNALNNAVRDGKITKPNSCSRCSSTTRIQGHHWSYEKENWLNVVWLCAKCHTQEHKQLRALDQDPDEIH